MIIKKRKALYLSVNVFSRKVLETGPPFYVVIRGTRRSSHMWNDSLKDNSLATLCIWWQMLVKEFQPISDAFFISSRILAEVAFLAWRRHFGFAIICQASMANFPHKLDRWCHIQNCRGRLGTRLVICQATVSRWQVVDALAYHETNSSLN